MSIIYGVLSAVFLACHSLAASKLVSKKEDLSAISVASLSLFPAFLVAVTLYLLSTKAFDLSDALILVLKNAMYSCAFFLRILAFQTLGGFAGSLLQCSQPILIGILGYFFLGEHLEFFDIISLFCVVIGLIFINRGNLEYKIGILALLKFILAPAIFMVFAVLLDRYVLRGEMSGQEFFIIDKLLLFPVMICGWLCMSPLLPKKETKLQFKRKFIFPVFILGVFWMVSSFMYGMALDLEKSVWVAVVRSFAFPLAALGSVILFQERINSTKALGFTFITLGCVFEVL